MSVLLNLAVRPCSEVVTIFHETGHAMQALLTTQTDVTVSGINGIEQDAIEQPSQFLERWYAAHPHGICLHRSPFLRTLNLTMS